MAPKMTDEQFAALVERGIDALPEHIRAKMRNVAIVIADAPTKEQMIEQGIEDPHGIFGLYEGIPLTERGAEYFALPDKITIFKNAILAAYTEPDDIAACVENTVWHEVAHHFGYGDEWIEREEARRKKTL